MSAPDAVSGPLHITWRVLIWQDADAVNAEIWPSNPRQQTTWIQGRQRGGPVTGLVKCSIRVCPSNSS